MIRFLIFNDSLFDLKKLKICFSLVFIGVLILLGRSEKIKYWDHQQIK